MHLTTSSAKCRLFCLVRDGLTGLCVFMWSIYPYSTVTHDCPCANEVTLKDMGDTGLFQTTMDSAKYTPLRNPVVYTVFSPADDKRAAEHYRRGQSPRAHGSHRFVLKPTSIVHSAQNLIFASWMFIVYNHSILMDIYLNMLKVDWCFCFVCFMLGNVGSWKKISFQNFNHVIYILN